MFKLLVLLFIIKFYACSNVSKLMQILLNIDNKSQQVQQLVISNWKIEAVF